MERFGRAWGEQVEGKEMRRVRFGKGEGEG